MTQLTGPLTVDMQIQIPRGSGLRFGRRHAVVTGIKPQGTTVRLSSGKRVTYAWDALQDAFARAGSA